MLLFVFFYSSIFIIVFILCFLLYVDVINFSIFARPPSPGFLRPGDVVTVVSRVLETIVAVL